MTAIGRRRKVIKAFPECITQEELHIYIYAARLWFGCSMLGPLKSTFSKLIFVICSLREYIFGSYIFSCFYSCFFLYLFEMVHVTTTIPDIMTRWLPFCRGPGKNMTKSCNFHGGMFSLISLYNQKGVCAICSAKWDEKTRPKNQMFLCLCHLLMEKMPKVKWMARGLTGCHAAMRFAIRVMNSKHVSNCRGPCRRNDPSSPVSWTKEMTRRYRSYWHDPKTISVCDVDLMIKSCCGSNGTHAIVKKSNEN